MFSSRIHTSLATKLNSHLRRWRLETGLFLKALLTITSSVQHDWRHEDFRHKDVEIAWHRTNFNSIFLKTSNAVWQLHTRCFTGVMENSTVKLNLKVVLLYQLLSGAFVHPLRQLLVRSLMWKLWSHIVPRPSPKITVNRAQKPRSIKNR